MEATEEIILKVLDDYKNTRSISQTASNMKLSTGTVRKMLFTAGIYCNKTARDILGIRDAHPDWDNGKIAKELAVSAKTVEMYTPYKEFEYMRLGIDRTSDTAGDLKIAAEGRCGDDAFWTLSESGRLRIYGSGPIYDYGGTMFGDWHMPRPGWWQRRDGIKVKKVTVEEGITSIGQYAFADLYDMSEVSLAGSVKELNGAVFLGENSLEKIVIPEGVEVVISWDLFFLCVVLKEAHIPASVREIKSKAFHGCLSLRKLYFYGNAPKIAATSFERCSGEMFVYHKANAAGWGDMWNGFRTEVF